MEVRKVVTGLFLTLDGVIDEMGAKVEGATARVEWQNSTLIDELGLLLHEPAGG